jgi:hypothetical protein
MGSMNGVPVELFVAWIIWVGGGFALMQWFRRASAAQAPPVPALQPESHAAQSGVRQSAVRQSGVRPSGVRQSGVTPPAQSGVHQPVAPSSVRQSSVRQSGVRLGPPLGPPKPALPADSLADLKALFDPSAPSGPTSPKPH